MAFIYRARYYLKVGNKVYQPGEEIPEAAKWWRLPAYIKSAKIIMTQTDVQQHLGNKQRIPMAPDEGEWEHYPHGKLVLAHQQMDAWGKDLSS